MCIIRKCNKNDIKGRAFVHYTSWKETYHNLIPSSYLDKLNLEKLEEIARENIDNTLVAISNNKIVGFLCYLNKARDFSSLNQAVEIVALYVLEAYQGKGIGKKLVDNFITKNYNKKVVLFVLKDNLKAIGFYKYLGFKFTGHKISQKIDSVVLEELEMCLEL